MKGAHDLGGRFGLGPIDAEDESAEPVFHAEWEKRAFALTLATGMLGQWNTDESRYARERQHPVSYLQNSYYENWLVGLENLLAEKGILDADLGDGQLRVPDTADAIKILSSGGPTLMEDATEPLFKIGDLVRVKKIQTVGHTRAPDYVQGAVARIATHYGTHIFPDANANGEKRGEHLYSVEFLGTDLWGAEAQASHIYVDLWEPYLETLAP